MRKALPLHLNIAGIMPPVEPTTPYTPVARCSRPWGSRSPWTHYSSPLPAYEITDEEDDDKGKFWIPNTEGIGEWELFDPRKEIADFQTSNTKTKGLTADLTRMLKTWVRQVATLDYASYELLRDVIAFLDDKDWSGCDYSKCSAYLLGFFDYIDGEKTDGKLESHIQTALTRVKKAVKCEQEGNPKDAAEWWQNIFGNEFPSVEDTRDDGSNGTRTFSNPNRPYFGY